MNPTGSCCEFIICSGLKKASRTSWNIGPNKEALCRSVSPAGFQTDLSLVYYWVAFVWLVTLWDFIHRFKSWNHVKQSIKHYHAKWSRNYCTSCACDQTTLGKRVARTINLGHDSGSETLEWNGTPPQPRWGQSLVLACLLSSNATETTN